MLRFMVYEVLYAGIRNTKLHHLLDGKALVTREDLDVYLRSVFSSFIQYHSWLPFALAYINARASPKYLI